jgi:flagellar assembly protein FliH
MSSFWSAGDLSAATAVPGFGDFGSLGTKGGFRSRFGASGAGAGWTAARAEMPDHFEPEPEPEPEIDPVEQASREGFVAGFHEGERVAREACEADDTVRRQLADAITLAAGAGEGMLASLLSQAVLRLVTQIVGEVPVDEAMLAERCAAIAACIDPDDGKSVLEVNPDDLPLIDTQGIAVALAPNPAISRGSVRLATADGWVEDGPDVRLARLKAMMDDMEGKL